ncbi:MAG: VWA domain-containing protein [Pseudomonadota bacterium]
MARRRRTTQSFNMSFLDCMSCGFGAVILFYVIITATVRDQTPPVPDNQTNEVRKVEIEVLDGRRDLVRLRNTLADAEDDIARADSESDDLIERIRALELDLSQFDESTLARRDSIEDLQSDIEQLEDAKKRLTASSQNTGPSGENVRGVVGDGQRQYLTGLRVGGERTLILVDTSASMLDDTIVGVIRRRVQPKERRLRAAKWRQTVASVEWLTSQLRPGSKFQVYQFNEDTRSLVPGSDGAWAEVDDSAALNGTVAELRDLSPEGGTNLYKAFEAAERMDPPPDNIVVLVDGLPTQGREPTDARSISENERQKLFLEAVRVLPGRVPVNVLMYQMEGEYRAAVLFWQLAYRSGGSYMSVSDDWP